MADGVNIVFAYERGDTLLGNEQNDERSVATNDHSSMDAG